MKKKKGLYRGLREGERGKLFSVHKWALRTRVQKSKSCLDMKRQEDEEMQDKNFAGCEKIS